MKQQTDLNRLDLLLAMLFIVLMVVISGMMAVYVLSDPGIRAGVRLLEAVATIEREGITPLSDRAIESARDSMFSRLDRYSGYVDKPGFDQMREEMSGAYGGIGVTIVPHDDGLLIMSVREDGPAGEVGLLSGDIIIGADSISFSRLTISEASYYLRGEPDTDVRVHIYRPVTGDTTAYSLTRRRVPLIHVPFAGLTERNMIYVRLLDFDAGAADDVRRTVDSLLHRSGTTPAGVILDLRSNPGGLFAEAYRTANIFLEPGTFIVGTDARSRWNEESHFALNGDITGGLPMAVIVNRGSASSAEIVAGALQQSGRAVLVGDTTFGKGLVQGFVPYPDGDGLRLTISRYFFDNNVYLNRFDSTLDDSGTGLAPDHYYPYPELDPYVIALESSLLLQEFAVANVETILAPDELSAFGPILSEFAYFLSLKNHAFATETTEAARALAELARAEQASPRIKHLADQLVARAEEADRDLLAEHAEHIALRLRQIAYEREHGVAATYRDVILPNRGDIKLAEEILMARQS